MSSKEDRLHKRLKLSIPARIKCRETETYEWAEMTVLKDVSPFGASFVLKRPCESGRLLHMTMPMPQKLRCYDYAEEQYRIWALVRHVRIYEQAKADQSGFLYGVAFIGKLPPDNYKTDPASRFEVDPSSTRSGLYNLQAPKREIVEYQSGDRRRHSRLMIPVQVTIEAFGEKGEVSAREETVTENISRCGAAVYSTIKLERGRFVRLSCPMYNLTLFAVVRSQSTGGDNISRLHLEFLHKEWPLEGFE
jgi:hypothetical protein